jgi:hypothetical protein
VDQALDRPATEPCAKRTLAGFARTGVLLMGAALAGILSVELPVPGGRAGHGQDAVQPYVPASGQWIELGPSALPPDLLRLDLLQRAPVSSSAARARRT